VFPGRVLSLLLPRQLEWQHPGDRLQVPQVRPAGPVQPWDQLLKRLPRVTLGSAVANHGVEDLLLTAVVELPVLQDHGQLGQVPLLQVLQGSAPPQGAAEPPKVLDTKIVKELLENLHVEDLTHLPEGEEGAHVSLEHVGPEEHLRGLPGDSHIQRICSDEHLDSQLVRDLELASLGEICQVLNKVSSSSACLSLPIP